MARVQNQVMLTRRRPDSFDDEFHSIVRKHAGLVHMVRLEALGERLASRHRVGVHEFKPGFCGDRVTMLLSDDRLTMSLLRPERRAACALTSLHWDTRAGWIVVGETAAGERVVYYAWKATSHRFASDHPGSLTCRQIRGDSPVIRPVIRRSPGGRHGAPCGSVERGPA